MIHYEVLSERNNLHTNKTKCLTLNTCFNRSDILTKKKICFGI